MKQALGYKRVENTFKIYAAAEELFKNEIEFTSKVAKTKSEICTFTDAGFDFVCDFNGHKLYRKKF